MRELIAAWQDWMWGLVAILVAMLVGFLAHTLWWWARDRLAKRKTSFFAESVNRHCRAPSALVLPILAVHFVAPYVRARWSETAVALTGQILTLALIVSLAWALTRWLSVAEEMILHRYDFKAKHNLEARRVYTQFRVLKKVAIAVIVILAIGIGMMTFESFRRVGAGILASAGVVGIVVGFAAQKVLGALLAGIQIALTQPIRLDDVVVVEKEWGRIEDITLTYVVVRIWDSRRLVLPTVYFLEKPFENWTLVSSDILGTVYLHVDYTVPLSKIRAKLDETVKQSPEWDGRVCNLLVTDATPRSLEIRALVSAEDSSQAWTLRCNVREQLIAFLQEEYPDSLPRVRTTIESFDGPAFSAQS